VFVEAWSYGKPVVCGTAPASRELIGDGETGLWSAQDPALLAEKLTILLESPALAKAMGNAGKHLQQESYTTERMVHSHLQAWQLVA
jgi:phosphatidyl-myo-inositol dimannoside synthase